MTCPIFGQWSDTRLGRGGPQNLTSRAFSGSNSRDSSAATATPPSTATTPPVPGAATGSGITAYAICQQPDLSQVMGTTSARKGSAVSVLHPADLADQPARAGAVVAPDPQPERSYDPQALMPAR